MDLHESIIWSPGRATRAASRRLLRATLRLLALSVACAGAAGAVPEGITPIAINRGDTQPAADGEVFVPTSRHLLAIASGPIYWGTVGYSSTSALFGPDGLGGSQQIFRAGLPLPGAPAETVRFVDDYAAHPTGAFGAEIRTFSGYRAILASSGLDAEPELVLLEGDPAPGVTDFGGATIDRFVRGGLSFVGSARGSLLGEDGSVATVARIASSVALSQNDEGLFGPDGAGGLTLLARENDPAPLDGFSTPGDACVFGSFNGTGFPAFRDLFFVDGHGVVFDAELRAAIGGSCSGPRSAIFHARSDGTITPILRAGFPLQTTNAGTIDVRSPQPIVNTYNFVPSANVGAGLEGDLVFMIQQASGTTGLYSLEIDASSGTTSVTAREGAREGAVVSGTESTVAGILEPLRANGFLYPTRNASGEVAFRADVTVSLENDCEGLGAFIPDDVNALIVEEPNGDLVSVAHELEALVLRNQELLPPEQSPLPFRFDTGFGVLSEFAFNNGGVIVFEATFREQDRCLDTTTPSTIKQYEGLFQYVPDGPDAGLWLVTYGELGFDTTEGDVYSLEIGGTEVPHRLYNYGAFNDFQLAPNDDRIAFNATVFDPATFRSTQGVFTVPEPGASGAALGVLFLLGLRERSRRSSPHG